MLRPTSFTFRLFAQKICGQPVARCWALRVVLIAILMQTGILDDLDSEPAATILASTLVSCRENRQQEVCGSNRLRMAFGSRSQRLPMLSSIYLRPMVRG